MSKMEIHDYIKDNTLIEISKVSDLGVSKELFYRYIRANNCEKVGPGMYVAPDNNVDELLVLSKRCPQGVISHNEALYFHGLIDEEPKSHTITVYSGYNASRLRKSGYSVFYVDKSLLELGKSRVVDNHGNEIPMYDMERSIVDMVRNRKLFEVQEYSGVLKKYIKNEERDIDKLTEYAKMFRVERILNGQLELLL